MTEQAMNHMWMYVSAGDLDVEWRQCVEEGKDVEPLREEFARVRALDLTDPANQPPAEALLDRTLALPIRSDCRFDEPSDLERILAARPPNSNGPAVPLPVDPDALPHRLHGAWLGRVCGCLLGKPVEGWRRPRMWGYLKDTGRWPLNDYFTRNAPAEVLAKHEIPPGRCYIETVDAMPMDDDTNYTVAALKLVTETGLAFTPRDVATFWMQNLPLLATCTAERVAYRNFAANIAPPRSATVRNPYREWIGAQIRADFFGYIAPGDPQRAAELAWRDASISHVKNGIYGEMWAAAMVAAAFGTDNVRTVLEAGLAQIPARCRLAADVRRVMDWHAGGVGYDDAVERIHQRWDETTAHGWCHTISNAMVVAAGLLYGEGDYGRSICRTVQPCFDTDCNGATVGSIVGAMRGASAIAPRWAGPVHDTLITGVQGYPRVSIAALANETHALLTSSAPSA